MTNEVKIIGMLFIFTIGLNLLVVPMVSDDGGLELKDLSPPESSILSEDFEVETDSSDSWFVPESLVQGVSAIIQLLNGVISTITWFFGILGGLIFGGVFSGNPILIILNPVVTVVGLVAFIKMLPST